MDQTLHQSLNVSLNAFGIQLHEFVTGCHQGSKQDMLLRFETGLFDLIDACGNQSEKKRRKWLDKQRQRLKKGQLSAVLAALKILAQGRRAKTVGKVIAYFKEHTHRMRYDYFQSIGIPIGSGAVESAIRRIVNQRMKGNGIFWYPDNAQRMFFIRCQLLSGRWQAFIKTLLCPNLILVQTPAALSWAA